MEVVFWLLSMLATRDQEDTARTLLAMSSSPESCVAMRRSGCLPLLLQILHGAEAGAGMRAGGPGAPGAKDARMRANAALHNIVFSQPDQGLARKEMRVLHVLEQIRAYCETCWDWLEARAAGAGPDGGGERAPQLWPSAGDSQAPGARSDRAPSPAAPVPIEPQICQATCAVMKLSFDEEYRRAMNELGECPPTLLGGPPRHQPPWGGPARSQSYWGDGGSHPGLRTRQPRPRAAPMLRQTWTGFFKFLSLLIFSSER